MHFFCENPLDVPKHHSYTPLQLFRRSSAVEQLTVNQLVVGSIPTAGAKLSLGSLAYNYPPQFMASPSVVRPVGLDLFCGRCAGLFGICLAIGLRGF